MPEPQTPAVVYFTHDISPEGLANAYKALGRPLEGRRVAVKISTGEAGNNHYLHPELIGPLVQSLQGDIVECNTAYAGKRMHTADHRKVIADHGFDDIAKVVILDEFAETELPTPAGAVVDYMGDRAVYISVMNNISIDCDCNGHPAKPEMADVGILASLDPVALDRACVDLVYASDPKTSDSLRARMEKQLGPHILDHAVALGYGTKSYTLVSLDGNEPPSTKRVD